MDPVVLQTREDQPRRRKRLLPIGTHLKTLGEIHNFEAGLVVPLSEVDDELVSATSLVVDKFDAVVVLEALHHIVGVEEGKLGRVDETRSTEHLDVGPRDGEDAGRAEWSGRNWSNGRLAAGGDDGVGGKEGRQVLSRANGSVESGERSARRSKERSARELTPCRVLLLRGGCSSEGKLVSEKIERNKSSYVHSEGLVEVEVAHISSNPTR